jgi:hypothetical protein
MESFRRVAELVGEQKAARPEMRARDVYKLLYQGVFGVGHIMGPGAWDYLQNEVNGVDPKDQVDDLLLESVSLDGSIVRVNLRPFIREGHLINRLMEAMSKSDIAGNPADFLEAWDDFTELVWSGQLDFENNEIDEINRVLDRSKPQPMHHTQQYREAYHPAYRIVRRREILKIIGI